MSTIVTFIHAHIITKQTLAGRGQAEAVVCQLGYKKTPASRADSEKGFKG